MKKILFLLIFALSAEVLSNPVNTTAAVPYNLRVFDTNGNTYVNLVSHGCSAGGYILGPNHMKYDTIVSILLAAQLSKNDVQIRYNGCNGNDQGIIVGVYIK